MEAEVTQDQQPILMATAKQKKNVNVLGIVSIAICCILIVSAVMLYMQLSETKTQMDNTVQQLDALKKDNNDLKQANDFNAKYISFLQFEHGAEGGVVTNSLVVNKLVFNGNDQPLNMTVDVTNQPTTALKYQGLGAYNMTDRDVKSMAAGIVEELKSHYDNFGGLPAWTEDATVTVTVQNYEIGTYKAGKFTLKGE